MRPHAGRQSVAWPDNTSRAFAANEIEFLMQADSKAHKSSLIGATTANRLHSTRTSSFLAFNGAHAN